MMIPALLLAQSMVLPLKIHPGIHDESPVYSFTVDLPSATSEVVLGTHSIEYRSGAGGKVSVRVAGGDWLPIDNSTAECIKPIEAAYGCIGSAFSTLTLKLPLALEPGQNTVEFRYNYNGQVERDFDGLSAARIFSVQFLSNGQDVGVSLPSRPLSALTASGDATDIAVGRDIFHNGTSSVPSCSSCHAVNAVLLAEFGFHEEVVVQSLRRGLSEREAEQVKAFIHSLRGDTFMEPWEPPYQPFPGADESEETWTHGGGIKWVVPSQEEQAAYFYEQRDEWHTDGSINLRIIPSNIQFMDSREWWPRTDPADCWNGWDNSSQVRIKDARIPALLSRSDRGSRSYVNEMASIGKELDDVKKHGLSSKFPTLSREYSNCNISTQLWSQVQNLWLFTAGGQDLAPVWSNKGEKHSWFGSNRGVFDNGPHIFWDNSTYDPHQANLTQSRGFDWDAHTDGWYVLSQYLNAGNGNIHVIKPTDFKYFEQFRRDMPGSFTGQVMGYLKHMQHMASSGRWGSGGMYMRHANIYPILLGFQSSYNTQGLSEEARVGLMEGALRAYVQEFYKWDWSELPRGEGNDQIEPAGDSRGNIETLSSGGAWRTDINTGFWYALRAGDESGFDRTLLDSLSTLGETLWPNGDWSFDRNGPETPEPDFGDLWTPDIGPTDPPVNIPPIADFTISPDSGEAPLTVILTDQSRDPDGTIATRTIEWGDGGTGGASHTYTVSGVYTVTLTVVDNSGASAFHSQQVVVTEPLPPPLNERPVASFSVEVSADTVRFTNMSTDDKGYTSHWQYSDGRESVEDSPVEVFPFGDHEATLTVTDEEGLKDAITKAFSIACDTVIVRDTVYVTVTDTLVLTDTLVVSVIDTVYVEDMEAIDSLQSVITFLEGELDRLQAEMSHQSDSLQSVINEVTADKDALQDKLDRIEGIIHEGTRSTGAVIDSGTSGDGIELLGRDVGWRGTGGGLIAHVLSQCSSPCVRFE